MASSSSSSSSSSSLPPPPPPSFSTRIARRIGRAAFGTQSDDMADELVILCKLAAPVILTYLTGMAQAIISQILVGHISPTALAAAALANMFANATGNAIIIGTAAASDTLCSQAFGARVYQRVGVVTQRGIAVGLTLMIPIAFVWWHADFVLIETKQPQEVIGMSRDYIRVLLFGLPASIAFESLKKHCINVGLTHPPMVMTLLGTLVNLLVGYILVYHTSVGFLGAPISMAAGYWTMLLTMIVYLYNHRKIHSGFHSVFGGCYRKVVMGTKMQELKEGEEEEEKEVGGKEGTIGVVAAHEQTQQQSQQGEHDTVPVAVVSTSATVASTSAVVVVENWAPLPAVDAVGNKLESRQPQGPPIAPPNLQLQHLHDDHQLQQQQQQLQGNSHSHHERPLLATDVHSVLDATLPVFNLRVAFSYSGWKEYLSLGLPSAAMLFSEWASYEATSFIAGLLGTMTLAIHTILAMTASLAFMPILGFAVAASMRIGRRMGERDPAGAKLVYKTTLFICVVYVILNALFIAAVHQVWARIFTDDEEVVSGVSTNLFILALYTVFDALQCVVCAAMRGLGKPSLAAVGNVLGYIVVGLPLAYVTAITAGAGLLGIWGSYCIAVFVVFVLLFIVTTRLDWKKASDVAYTRALAETSPKAAVVVDGIKDGGGKETRVTTDTSENAEWK